MTRNQQGPRCRNSWRPSDHPLYQQDLRQQRSPVRLDPSSQSLRPATSRTSRTTPEPPSQMLKNPNLIPVMPRYPQSTALTSPIAGRDQGYEQEEEPARKRLPQIWHPSIDDLIRRTAHDYDLVMNYERDAEGGQRWLSEDVARIRDIGRHLHNDIFALRRWQRVVAEEGDQDKTMIQKIKRDANFLKLLCERIQKAINKYEQKCGIELLKNGVYAQDEDGNFYKPTSPQQYMAEGGFLQEVAHPSIETTEDDILGRLYGHNQHVHLPEEHQRNPTFDSASSQPPFPKPNSKPAYQTPPRNDRVLSGRISKPHQDPPSSNATPLPQPSPKQNPANTLTLPARRYRAPSPESRTAPAHPPEHREPYTRTTRNNRDQRNGLSRREAKKAAHGDRHPGQTVGRLGKHVLHY